MEAIEEELAHLVEPVPCRRCIHPYPQHADAGGACREIINGRFPCTCPGMQWVDPDGPAESYAPQGR